MRDRQSGARHLPGSRLAVNLTNHPSNFVGPNHPFFGLETQIGLEQSVALFRYCDAFDIRAAEINSNGASVHKEKFVF